AADAGVAVRDYAVPLAETRARRGDVDAALELLETVPAAERDPDHWIARAGLLVQTGELDAAKEALDQVSGSAAAGSAALLAARARLAVAHRDGVAAAALLRQAREADPTDPDVLLLLAAVEIAS